MNRLWIKSSDINTVSNFKKDYCVLKNLVSANLKITSMGMFRVLINGESITNNVFMPGYTSFPHRVQEFSYDLTSFFKEGNNLIEIYLASGWGGAKWFGWERGMRPYFEPSLNFEFEFSYKDNTEYLVSNEDWDVYSSFILSSEIYDGEIQDKTAEIKYLGKAIINNEIKTNIIPNIGCDIIEGEHIIPKSMFRDNNGDLLVDFGQNFTGYINIKIKGKRGEKISFVPGEILDKNGNFYNENYRSAKSFFSYTLTGSNDDFKPWFSFQGLRYIKILDKPEKLDLSNFTGILVHSDIRRTGFFESGNALINKLYKNIIYGQLSNYLDIPTDCPQRDERLGWLGDAEVFVRTAAINFDVKKFFKKWLGDVALDQYENGAVEGVSPIVCGLKTNISSGWGDAAVICPWEIYLAYNDVDLLRENYPMMVKWIGYLKSVSNDFIWDSGNHYGDWLALDAPYGESVGATDISLVATAFFYHSIDIVSIASSVLGFDNKEYLELKENIKKSFQKKFLDNGLPKGYKAYLNSKEGRTPYTQTGIALILHFGLCEESDKAKLSKALVELIKENGNRMTTGFLGTPFILHVLSDNGYNDVAYDLLFQEKAPSWLFPVLHGATTMWEHWDGVNDKGEFWSKAMNSFNHYAYGAVYDWIFSHSVGIKLLAPGYKEVVIEPIIDKRLGFVSGGIETKYGKLSVEWNITKDNIDYHFVIPKGIKATVIVNNKKYQLSNGTFYFTSSI